ncbi:MULTISPECIES: hypothetical protein [Dysgonomonas]|nr:MULTISPECIES: hypothetical protein [Dysgonomonas]
MEALNERQSHRSFEYKEMPAQTLYCASVGLGSVARGSFTRPDLHNTLKLTDKQEITFVQPVGYIK